MGLEQTQGQGKTYANILSSDGTIRVQSTQDNPKAIRRDYEVKDDKTGKKTKGTKYELVYNKISGIIVDMELYDGSYGTMINISMVDKGESFIFSSNAAQNYGTDIMKKLPNVDLKQEVTFAPYCFDVEGKTKKGVTVYQNGEKLMDFFYDGKKNINGIPEVAEADRKKFKTDDWKMYFMTVCKFLKDYTQKEIIDKATFETVDITKDMSSEAIADEINIDKVDFED